MTTPKITGSNADLTLPEVRVAFMAQYFPQHVLRYVGAPLGVENWKLATSDKKMFDLGISRSYLLLRHISSLTEEEKQTIEKIEDCDDPYSPGFIEWPSLVYKSNEPGHRYARGLTLDSYDFLRSIGILIPFRANSCEELIDSGLAVYRKEE